MANINVKKLAQQLDIAQSILDEIRVTSGCEVFGPRKAEPPKRTETALETALRALGERKKRADFVGNERLFGEPAWDMLLDLFIRQTREEQISVKSACFGGDAPPRTAVRWLAILEQNGLVSTKINPLDETVRLIHLTAEGYEGMLRYLESIAL